jgi:hypothetical protein
MARRSGRPAVRGGFGWSVERGLDSTSFRIRLAACAALIRYSSTLR